MASQSLQGATKLLINAATTQVGGRSQGISTDADGNDRKIAAKEAITSYDHVPIELPPSMHESTQNLASLYTLLDAYMPTTYLIIPLHLLRSSLGNFEMQLQTV